MGKLRHNVAVQEPGTCVPLKAGLLHQWQVQLLGGREQFSILSGIDWTLPEPRGPWSSQVGVGVWKGIGGVTILEGGQKHVDVTPGDTVQC